MYELPGKSLATNFRKREPKEFKWSGLDFTVDHGNKQILRQCWGRVPPSKVCAIMGPSGSGKSSMLNCLAGRSSTVEAAGIQVTGRVKVDNKYINPVEFRRNIAYVMQDDSLMGTATPREALTFSAKVPAGTVTP